MSPSYQEFVQSMIKAVAQNLGIPEWESMPPSAHGQWRTQEATKAAAEAAALYQRQFIHVLIPVGPSGFMWIRVHKAIANLASVWDLPQMALMRRAFIWN